ncbi:MAG: DUF481 domain-containing protein [bacterium]|nr:DUF481 domain-containing protein [bacterium]
MSKTLLLFIFIVLLSPFSAAQVNIEKVRLGGQTSSFNMSANFQSVEGNVNYMANALDVRFDDRVRYWDWFVLVNSSSRISDGETISSYGFIHLRASHPLRHSKYIELFSQFESRPFSKLNSRELIGFGLRYDISLTGIIPFALGIGLMSEHEVLEDGEAHTLRSTNYVSASYPIGKGANFRMTAYYQPSTADSQDYRLLSDTELAIRLGQRTYWKSSFVFRYDSNPESGVRSRDVETRQGIGLSL